ncbi:MAG: hypothetical protein J6C07_08825 [Lachnospiraceae bacterium]|nr:hypothetical protein [Lachnospiraceae bacterium]
MCEQNTTKKKETDLKDGIGIKLDMVQLNCILVDDIFDLERLFQCGIAKYNIAAHNHIELRKGEKFTSLCIKNASCGIKEFTYKICPDYQGRLKAYGSLQLIVDDPELRNLNCRSFSEFKDALLDVKLYLEECYGICISYSKAMFHTIEINKTFAYSWNHDALELLISIIPPIKRMPYRPPFNIRTGKGVNAVTDVSEFTAFSKGFKNGKGACAKFYDKTKQLQDMYKIEVDDDYLRFELAFANAKKIQQVFGTNKLKDFSQEIIDETFYSFVDRCFIRSYDDYCVERRKLLKKIFVNEFEKEPRSIAWIQDAILKIIDIEKERNSHQILQDINEIYEIWKAIPFSNRFQRAKFKRKLTNICRDDFPLLLTDIDNITRSLLLILSQREEA